MDNEQRLMILTIPYREMLGILRGDVRIVDLDIPADTVVVDVSQDWKRRGFSLMLRSGEFGIVPDGDMVAELPPILFQTVRESE